MKGNREIAAKAESNIKTGMSKFQQEDVASGGRCAVYCVWSLEGRGKRCIKRYEKTPSQDYLEILELMRAPRGMNVPVVFNWSVSGHHADELVVEEGFTVPRHWVDGLTPGDEPDAQLAVDDVVDDVIETVLLHGGEVAFVAPGTLDPEGHIGLILRGS